MEPTAAQERRVDACVSENAASSEAPASRALTLVSVFD